jgi:hypothetical protein
MFQLSALADVKVIKEEGIQSKKDLDLKNGTIILLKNDLSDIGHFVCVWKHKGVVYYFDSYGIPMTSEYLKRALGGKAKISNNPVIYQKLDSSTCGSHCGMRLALKHLNHKEYYEAMLRLIKELNTSPDRIVASVYAVITQ